MKCFKTLNNAKGTANVKNDFLFLLCFLLQTMQLYLSGFFSYQFVEILLGRVNLSIGRDSPSNLVYIAQCWPLFNWRLNIVSYFSTICLINFVRKLILSNLFLFFWMILPLKTDIFIKFIQCKYKIYIIRNLYSKICLLYNTIAFASLLWGKVWSFDHSVSHRPSIGHTYKH